MDKSVKKTKGNSNTSQKPKHVPIKLKQSQWLKKYDVNVVKHHSP